MFCSTEAYEVYIYIGGNHEKVQILNFVLFDFWRCQPPTTFWTFLTFCDILFTGTYTSLANFFFPTRGEGLVNKVFVLNIFPLKSTLWGGGNDFLEGGHYTLPE